MGGGEGGGVKTQLTKLDCLDGCIDVGFVLHYWLEHITLLVACREMCCGGDTEGKESGGGGGVKGRRSGRGLPNERGLVQPGFSSTSQKTRCVLAGGYKL